MSQMIYTACGINSWLFEYATGRIIQGHLEKLSKATSEVSAKVFLLGEESAIKRLASWCFYGHIEKPQRDGGLGEGI